MLASATSPVCDPADPTFVCAKPCDAQLAAECADPYVSRAQCISDCVAADAPPAARSTMNLATNTLVTGDAGSVWLVTPGPRFFRKITGP